MLSLVYTTLRITSYRNNNNDITNLLASFSTAAEAVCKNTTSIDNVCRKQKQFLVGILLNRSNAFLLQAYK